MKITRRQAIALAGTTAAAVVGGSSSRATAAVAYSVSVFTVENSGTPTVMVSGEVPAAQVAVSAYAADGTLVATLTDLAFMPETFFSPNGGWWRSPQRLRVPVLGVRYDLVVEVTSASGETYRQTFPQAFLGIHTSRLANLAFAPARIDTDHRSTILSGDLIGNDPRTGADVPLGGQEVEMTVSYPNGVYLDFPPLVKVVTDAQGYFAATLHADAAGKVRVAYNGQYLYAESCGTSVDLLASVRPVRLTVAPDQPRTPYGETVRLTGRLESQVAGEWVPYPGQRITLAWGEEGSAVTDADGVYSITIVAEPKTYTVAFNSDYHRDYLVAGAEATTEEIKLIYPVSVEGFVAWHTGQGVWQVYGNVAYGGWSRGITTVHLQTAVPGTQQWTTIKSVDTVGVGFQTAIKATSVKILRAQVDGDEMFREGFSDGTYFIGPEVKHFPPKVQTRLR